LAVVLFISVCIGTVAEAAKTRKVNKYKDISGGHVLQPLTTETFRVFGLIWAEGLLALLVMPQRSVFCFREPLSCYSIIMQF